MTAPEPMRALWVTGPNHGTVAEMPGGWWAVAVPLEPGWDDPEPRSEIWGVHLLRIGGRQFRVLLPPRSYERDGLPKPEWVEKAILALIDATRMQVQAVERSK